MNIELLIHSLDFISEKFLLYFILKWKIEAELKSKFIPTDVSENENTLSLLSQFSPFKMLMLLNKCLNCICCLNTVNSKIENKSETSIYFAC